jgi:GT2 family glycosyltransferase
VRTSIALLTYNRKQLFLRTLSSLYSAGHKFDLSIYDNGSNDGTADLVREIGGTVNASEKHTTGHGMNRVIEMALEHKPELILFTADDFHYRPDFLASLVDFWEHAPQDVIMASCYLEPDWDWNKVQSVGNAGGQRYALRDSIPGSNWSFRLADLDKIYPVSEKTGGEDLEICQRLRAQGYSLAALDLVKHIGETQSAWGNESYRYARPLDFAALGFAEWSV